MKWSSTVVSVSVVALLAAAALVPRITFASTAPAGAICSDVTLPVSIIAGGPKNYQKYGRLCHPASGPSKTIQILIHGYTYDHNYWSVPGFGDKYDYVAVANAAGYTTFALDELGTAGQSSRPLSGLVNLLSDAVSLHDVVTAARTGAIPGGPYTKVLTVGHSYGTATAWQESVLYNDVDGMISSDLGHLLGNLQGLGTSTIPALLDPRLQPLVGLDAGYTTTTPGSRGPLFYNSPDADPAVIAYDEQTKGIGTVTELGTLALYETASLGIRVPMLFVIGQYDGFFCLQAGKLGLEDCSTDATIAAAEKPFFPLVPNFQTYVLPGAGHDINLHLNAADWYNKAASWATAMFPPNG